jgi:GTP-binding protein HflX
VDRRLAAAAHVLELELDAADGERLAWLYRHGTVLERRDADGRTHLRVALPAIEHARLRRELPEGDIVEPVREIPSDGR